MGFQDNLFYAFFRASHFQKDMMLDQEIQFKKTKPKIICLEIFIYTATHLITLKASQQ